MSGIEEVNVSDNECKAVNNVEEIKKELPDFDSQVINDEDVIHILVATDIHLGYEQTTKRTQENDSFDTFEEILQHAKENKVDMILLGGDLFHEAKPAHNVVMRCINLLRKYCLSDDPVKIKFLTNPEDIFSHCYHKVVNYEDPNLNIGIPVFSIHGNHDDPSYGAVGSMDVLSSTGFVNYFGKWTDVTEVTIAPLLIRKGITTLALYGLSYMNDQRLSRLMRNEKFNMLRCNDIGETTNVFVLHQNRAQHSRNSFVPENLLPSFLNLVIWGHEHECLEIPEQCKWNKDMYIYQPGSSVATSLAQGEAAPKHIGLLKVYKGKFKIKPIKLQTVRPFVFENLVISEHNDEITTFKNRTDAVEEYIDNYIENSMIPLAAKQQTGHPNQPEKPLLRLRIFYSDDKDMFDTIRLSQKYYHVSANPNDMIVFRKCAKNLKKQDIIPEDKDFGKIGEIFRFDDNEKDWKLSVHGGMTEYFSKPENTNKLTVLSLSGLNEALARYVNANDGKAFHDLIRHQMKKTLNHLMEKKYKDKQEIIEAIHTYRTIRQQREEIAKEEESCFDKRKDSPHKSDEDDPFLQNKNVFDYHSNNDDNEDEVEIVPAKGSGRGRGRGRGRGASKPKAKDTTSTRKPRGRASKNATILDVTTTGRDNHTLTSWKKTTQNNTQSSSKNQQVYLLDSDSE